MSHYVAVTDLPAGGEKLQSNKLVWARSFLGLLGLVGLGVSLFIFFFLGGESGDAALPHATAANAFGFSWLFGFEVFFTITVGTLFWVLLHNASNSSWGVAIRRIPETLALNFLPLFLLGLLIFGALYFWQPGWQPVMWEWIGVHNDAKASGIGSSVRDTLGASHSHLLYHKYPYLHLGFDSIIPGWDMRVLIFFGALFGIALKMRAYSVSQDATGDLQPTLSARRFASGMLPVFAVCSTFAALDWIKSLNYTWFSTMFGVNVFAGSAMASMALVILVVGFLIRTGHFKHVVTEEHFHLMGKLMHAFVIFWAYIAFSQFFLIWYANIPEETQFFAIRNSGGWWYVSLCLVFLHFVVPFVLLLPRKNKRKLGFVMGAAAFLIGMHILELYWMILPERGRSIYDATSGPGFTFFRDLLFDALALITIGSICGWWFLKNLARNSIYPCGDPRLEESINVVS